MRDASLFYLFSPVSNIKGVGNAAMRNLQRLLPAASAKDEPSLPLIRDLLFHLPVSIVDRSYTCPLPHIQSGMIATFIVKIDEHIPPPPGIRRGGKRPYRILCSNDTGELTLVFFNPRGDYLSTTVPVGSEKVVSGRVEWFESTPQMTHPDIIAPVSKLKEVQKAEPVYPLTVGLTSRRIYSYVSQALKALPNIEEWIEPEFIKQRHWPTWQAALNTAHNPATIEELSPDQPARQRLAYDEMLALQLQLGQLRRNRKQQAGYAVKATGKLTNALEKSLPFTLTKGQTEVLETISKDMQSGQRMSRLLQGDVGSGKTIVALIASLQIVESGGQAALMVPTEMIAQQHYATLTSLLKDIGLNVRLLTGSVKGKARKAILEEIENGTADIVVGTHALFQDHVNFHTLGLVIIDEQHRFGVKQRMALLNKGSAPHLLHMSATPIPRTLTMMVYGDMDCSILKEKPAERKPITTRVIPVSRYEDIMSRMKSALDRGEKAYWVCPLIEEKPPEDQLNLTPDQDIAAAESRYIEFKARFGEDKVAMVHGRMKADIRAKEMERFAHGAVKLLVATTVVEVGVDVRDATIIVIEKAERFGLAQLHQLRGRVGRGDQASACVLLYSDNSGEIAKTRLSILRDSEDGFAIAEADLEIRGGGELLGRRQSGMPRFIFTDFMQHQGFLEHARSDANTILENDPKLESPRGKALQKLQQLFD